MNQKKIVSIEDRIPKFKEARKKKANRRLVFYLCAFFLLISIVIYIQSPLSEVKTVKISGNVFLSTQEVKEWASIADGKNIWSVHSKRLEQRLKAHPIIQSASVERDLPRTVKIRIKEYERIGYIEKNNKYEPLLSNGKTLKTAAKKSMPGDAPVISDFSKPAYLKKMAEQLQKLNPSIHKLISEVHWKPAKDNPDKIELYMNDGFVVDGTIRDFAKKMEVYPSIVSQIKPGTKGIIHIGVGAYFEKRD